MLPLLHPRQFTLCAYITLLRLLFLLLAQLGQVGSLVDKTALDELFARGHISQQCLALFLRHLLNHLFAREGDGENRCLIGVRGKTHQRGRQVTAASQQEQVLKRTLLDRAILPLLDANQARFQGFCALERV